VAAEEAFWLEDLRTWGDGSDVPEEDDGIEAALLNYGRMRASRWGAERFAAEFRRRDEEEQQQLRAEAAQRSLHRSGPRPVRRPMMLTGLVDASVEDRVIGAEPGRLEFVGRHRAEPDLGPLLQPWRSAPAPIPEAPFKLDIRLADDGAQRPERRLVDRHEVGADEPRRTTFDHPQHVADEPLTRLIEDDAAVADEPPTTSVPEPPASTEEPSLVRHPHVPRPPAPAAEPEAKRKWFDRRRATAPSREPAISSAELARMTPAARRLYGLDQ
jgi:hypothetical protein